MKKKSRKIKKMQKSFVSFKISRTFASAKRNKYALPSGDAQKARPLRLSVRTQDFHS